MKKVMIFYAAYGGGHLSAARSLKENIETNYKNIEIKLQQKLIQSWQKKHHVLGEEFIGTLKKVH